MKTESCCCRRRLQHWPAQPAPRRRAGPPLPSRPGSGRRELRRWDGPWVPALLPSTGSAAAPPAAGTGKRLSAPLLRLYPACRPCLCDEGKRPPGRLALTRSGSPALRRDRANGDPCPRGSPRSTRPRPSAPRRAGQPHICGHPDLKCSCAGVALLSSLKLSRGERSPLFLVRC